MAQPGANAVSNPADLKAELLDLLDLPAWAHLRARLEKATITEPRDDGHICVEFRTADGRKWGAVFQDLTPAFWPRFVACVEIPEPKPAPPTDAELIAALRVELGEGWEVQPTYEDEDEEGEFFSASPVPCSFWLHGSYASLRSPNGPAEVARALRVLAGQGAE